MPENAQHPRGIYTLFFTEMWERFSYYGMRALLILFMVAAVEKGGLGFDDKVAAAIYGLYTAGAYMAALPGGWVADRLLGAQRAVVFGGCLIAAGQFTLAIPSGATFFPGLILLMLGTGLLKPNVSVMVGHLYPEGGVRRDAGFTIFYMGINLGATIGPLVCSTLGEKVNWHYGFLAAGIGMVLGLIQFLLTRKHLGHAGLTPTRSAAQRRRDWTAVGGALAVVVLAVLGGVTGLYRIDPRAVANVTAWIILGVAVLYFVYAFAFAGLDAVEKHRVAVIAVLFVTCALFWAGFEQAGSSLNLFADRFTERHLALLNQLLPADWVQKVNPIPAGWFQSLNPIYVITLAPVIAALWPLLARHKINPPVPVKFAIGLILLGAGFLVMWAAAKLVAGGAKVWPLWLVATYLLHTLGELCLSPVGLSTVTKLAPPRLVGQMMGIWFLGASLGNLIAGLVAGSFSFEQAGQMPLRFLQMTLIVTALAVVLILATKPIKRWTHGVE